MHAVIRGKQAEIVWDEGELSGDPVLVDRCLREAAATQIDLTDPIATIRCLEAAIGERPSVDVISM